jgi:hypothetical protein
MGSEVKAVAAAAEVAMHKPSGLAWLTQPDMIFRIGLLLVLALYLRTLAFDFVYDDLFIPVNPWLLSWHGIIDAFKSDLFGASGTVGSSYYRPLSSVIGLVVMRLTPGTPGWFHFSGLATQVIFCALCYWFSRLFFEDDLLAAVTTVLFVLHPTKVETIAWIGSSECDTEAAVYLFAAMGCYLQWWKSRKPAWAAGSIGLFALAMFTKETMLVVPVLLALHYWLRRSDSERAGGWITLFGGYAVIVAGYLLARHAVLKPLPAGSIAIAPSFTAVNVWTMPQTFWWYIQHLLYPVGLAILYDFRPVIHPDFWSFELPLIAAIALVGILAFAWARTRSWRLVFLGAWFVLLIGPPLALAPLVTVHDRYLHLPSYSFCALVAWAGVWTVRNRPQWRWVALSGMLAIVAAWSVGTWHESGYWDNNLGLWQRAVQVAPHNINARVELARLYAVEDPARGIRELDAGLRAVPGSPGLWRTRGLLLFNNGRYDEAEASLRRSLDESARFDNDPSEPADVRYGRATASFVIGEIEMMARNPSGADPWLRAAIGILPNNPDYLRVMVANLRKQGRNTEAETYQKQVDAIIARTRMKK